MATAVTTTTIMDGERNTTLRVHVLCDTANVSLAELVDIADFAHPADRTYTTFRVHELEYDVSDGLTVDLLWDGATDKPLWSMHQQGEVCAKEFGGIGNSATTPTGIINIQTTGWSTGTLTANILMKMIKQ